MNARAGARGLPWPTIWGARIQGCRAPRPRQRERAPEKQKDTAMTDSALESTDPTLTIKVADLARRQGAAFSMIPDGAARTTLAADLMILGLRKVRFQGALAPHGQHDWQLTATLGATAVQACVVTGDPVTTRIDVPVQRRFLRDMPEPGEIEAEIPDDDTLEPLGAQIDLGLVLTEALSLALPDYPRAEGAVFDSDETADERPNPFAALAALKIGDTPAE